MLSFLIPKKSSLSAPLRRFLSTAGYSLGEGSAEDMEVNGVRFTEAGRRSIPTLIAGGAFDAGITGYDLYLNAGVELRSVEELCFSRSSARPTYWVLACKKGWEPGSAPVRIVSELPRLAEHLLKKAKVPFSYSIEEIDGNEESWVKFGMADCVFVVTETGGSLRRNGLSIVKGCEELLVSTPRIFACKNMSAEKEGVLQNLAFALKSTVEAQAMVMVTFDIDELHLSKLDLRSAAVAPTISPLEKKGWISVQICIPRTMFGLLGCLIKDVGGQSIVMQNIDGYAS